MRNLFIAIALFLCTGINAQNFSMATYNLRNDNNADDAREGNGWQRRLPHMLQLIRFHGFEIFGTEEGFKHQLEDLKAGLPGYEYIGVGRDDGKDAGEHSAIFYDTSKFELLDHGDFWLSENPDRPGLGWDAVCVRICTWGKFKIKGTKFVFMYYNLHMDHVGVTARAESAKLIMKKIRENRQHLPAILSGDFNIDQNDPGYKLIATSGLLFDAYEIAPFRYCSTSTFNDFNPAGEGDNERIDHIFLTKDFAVSKYGILTDTYRAVDTDAQGNKVATARTPSDHFPVQIFVSVKKHAK